MKHKYRGRGSKDKEIFDAHIRYGYALREIGDYFGVHYATVSRAIKRAETMRWIVLIQALTP